EQLVLGGVRHLGGAAAQENEYLGLAADFLDDRRDGRRLANGRGVDGDEHHGSTTGAMTCSRMPGAYPKGDRYSSQEHREPLRVRAMLWPGLDRVEGGPMAPAACSGVSPRASAGSPFQRARPSNFPGR